MQSLQLRLKVNGEEREVAVDTRALLVELLRDYLDLTGTHVGCLTGNCGACTVMMNGLTVKSCTVLAVQAQGAEIVTIEGLSDRLKLSPIQQAFTNNYALQCGFCTPGMIISAYYLLSRNPKPSEEEIRLAIAGNLCRCTGYQNIVKAITEAATALYKNKDFLRYQSSGPFG